jgi:serine/threonine-protein kinase
VATKSESVIGVPLGNWNVGDTINLTEAKLVGTTVAGRYKLLRVLGTGGHGAVFEAEHVWTSRRVVVKLLRDPLRSNREATERFLREARTAARIEHPNVVQVLDMGRDDVLDDLFLVQELVRGCDLNKFLEERRVLSIEETLAIVLPLLDGLATVHAAGVLHRDIKPANVMLASGASGSVIPKLIDFGISKLADEHGVESLTRTGALLGTPAYMSPEQLRGERLGPEGDVWAMGVMLYEMLAGRRPFEGANYNVLVIDIATRSPLGLELLCPDAPPEVVEAISRALVKEPSKRMPSAVALREALLRASGGRVSSSVLSPTQPTLAATLPMVDVPFAAAVAPDTIVAKPPARKVEVAVESTPEDSRPAPLQQEEVPNVPGDSTRTPSAWVSPSVATFAGAYWRTAAGFVGGVAIVVSSILYMHVARDASPRATLGTVAPVLPTTPAAPVRHTPETRDHVQVPPRPATPGIEMVPAPAPSQTPTSPEADLHPENKGDDHHSRRRLRTSGGTSRAQSEPRVEAPAPAEEPANTPDLPERPTRSQITAVLTRLNGAVRACAQEQTGTAPVVITIDNNGTVRSAIVSGPFAGSAEGACIANVVRNARFQPFRAPQATLTWPFVILPSYSD